jgi:predicted dehydrogenase
MVFACAGMGGYAGTICDLLLDESARDGAPVHLAAVCDPRPEDHSRLRERLRSADVKIFSDYAQMLRENLDAVWLPLPIHLHRSATELALNAGLAVMCEKPVAGSIDDLDAIAALQSHTNRPVAIGYQDMYDPATLLLKQRLLAGDIGDIRRVVLRGTWPRDDQYFNRNNWAGKLRVGDAWVLDSPVNNAMAHFLNLALFLLGPSPKDSAVPVSIDAELYRVNAIENFDTCALRITLESGAVLLVLLTHACQVNFGPTIELRGDDGTIVYTAFKGFEVIRHGGSETVGSSRNVRVAMVDRFTRLVRGTLGDELVATLATSRPPLVVVNGASEAAIIHNIPSGFVGCTGTGEGGQLRFIENIEQAFERCARQFKLPHETAAFSWTHPHGTRDLRGYHHFAGPARFTM